MEGIDWGSLIAQLLIAIVTVVAPVLATLLGNLILKGVKNSQTKIDDRLAGLAVAWAEDNLGSDTGKGKEKLDMAIEKLFELGKGKISRSQAELLVRAAYQNLMGGLSPLKNA